MSRRSDARVIKQPLPLMTTPSHLLCHKRRGRAGINIAKNDTRVKQIISETKGKAATIAAVQPICFLLELTESLSIALAVRS
jgi:hypothetical protein